MLQQHGIEHRPKAELIGAVALRLRRAEDKADIAARASA